MPPKRASARKKTHENGLPPGVNDMTCVVDSRGNEADIGLLPSPINREDALAASSLTAGDSMFRPSLPRNRIEEPSTGLMTRSAVNEIHGAQRSPVTEDHQSVDTVSYETLAPDSVTSSDSTSKRKRGVTPDAESSNAPENADLFRATEAKRRRDDITVGPAHDAEDRVRTGDVRSQVSPAEHESQATPEANVLAERGPHQEAQSTNVAPESSKDDKGKGKDTTQTETMETEADHEDIDDGPSGDEEDAKQLRIAIDASLREANNNNRIGESSTSASHTVAGAAPPLDAQPHTPVLVSNTPLPLTPTTPAGSSEGQVSPSPSRRSFASARQQISGVRSRPISSPQSSHFANEYRVRALPERCEVNNPVLQDDLLRSQYDGLPNLTHGVFIPWSQIRGPGQFPFSHWGDVCPTMDFENAMAFMTFSSAGAYLNPSRASPLLTTAVRTSANGLRMNLHVGDDFAVLMSPLYVRQSHLLAPPARGLRQHLIGGVGHTQEWERQVAFICMAFGRPELRAQLSADVMTYATRTDTTQAYASTTAHFSATQSPSIRIGSGSGSAGRASSMSLGYNEPVPVYDARDTAVDLSNFGSLFNLPRFGGEIPAGSFAVVGYTANAYLSNRDTAWHVSCNLRFIVLVGTPSAVEEPPEAAVEDTEQ